MVENKKLDRSLVMEEIAAVHPSAAEEMLHLREQLKTEKEQKVNGSRTNYTGPACYLVNIKNLFFTFYG